ncbi:uncharacterized protein NEMAJ01_1014 [Nematocida major]|uniref:uncharacterized protein n=1 Tax=Nematocida major TaxID=1912982 RepID=UPI002007D443|nr:uncharacterized protein NEMAJ01_1014 [Nematocida major]KAH9386118.1 hypothetical protein NEMAJ01_1014 [Nematocida major]
MYICLNIGRLKKRLLEDTANIKTTDSASLVLKALSSRIKTSLENIPEEKRTKIEAIVDTFLQEFLTRILAKIANNHCIVSPETLDILTKEAIAEVPSELLHGFPTLSTLEGYDTFKQRVVYENFFMHALNKKIELYKYYKKVQQYIIACSTAMLQRKEMDTARKCSVEPLLCQDSNKLKRITATLNDLLKEEEFRTALGKTMKKEKMCTDESILNMEKYTLDRIVEKFKAYFCSGEYSRSLCFGLKKLTENNGKYASGQAHFIQGFEVHNKDVFSDDKISAEEKERIYGEMCIVGFYESVSGLIRVVIDREFGEFLTLIGLSSACAIIETCQEVDSHIQTLQEPEKSEMERYLKDLEGFRKHIQAVHNTFFANLYRIHDFFQMVDSPSNTVSGWGRETFAFFNVNFKKTVDRFPNVETNSGFGKAFHALMSHADAKNKRARQMHRNAMKAEECLARMNELDEGTSREDRDRRVDEYKKFARENPVPGFSGSIEGIPPESLEYGVTPREIKAMLSAMKISLGVYTEQLKDGSTTESEKVELKKSLSETEEKIRVLEEKLFSFADLSEEEAQREDCLRYAYLMNYKIECLKHIDVLKKEAEAELVPLAKEVMREIEEIPNTPKFNKKVEKMLETILKKEPHRLLTPEFIIKNEYFLKELPEVMAQLNKEIAEVLKETPGEEAGGKQKHQLTLQASIFILFAIFVLLSVGLVCNSEAA